MTCQLYRTLLIGESTTRAERSAMDNHERTCPACDDVSTKLLNRLWAALTPEQRREAWLDAQRTFAEDLMDEEAFVGDVR